MLSVYDRIFFTFWWQLIFLQMIILVKWITGLSLNLILSSLVNKFLGMFILVFPACLLESSLHSFYVAGWIEHPTKDLLSSSHRSLISICFETALFSFLKPCFFCHLHYIKIYYFFYNIGNLGSHLGKTCFLLAFSFLFCARDIGMISSSFIWTESLYQAVICFSFTR